MCVNLPNIWVNYIFLRKFCKETHCFLEKITQLETILHDRRSRRSRLISSLLASSQLPLCVCFMNSMKLDWFPTLYSQTTKSHKEYGGSLSKVEKLATGGIFFHFSLSEEVSAQLDKRSDKIEIFWNISKNCPPPILSRDVFPAGLKVWVDWKGRRWQNFHVFFTMEEKNV